MLTLRLRPKPLGSVPEHRQIVEAIRQGDGSLASERTKQHRMAARDLIVPLLARYGMKHL